MCEIVKETHTVTLYRLVKRSFSSVHCNAVAHEFAFVLQGVTCVCKHCWYEFKVQENKKSITGKRRKKESRKKVIARCVGTSPGQTLSGSLPQSICVRFLRALWIMNVEFEIANVDIYKWKGSISHDGFDLLHCIIAKSLLLSGRKVQY